MSDQRTVRVATCHDPAEATVIRAVLSAHGIDAIIPGEGAPSVGTTAVGFRTHVFVDSDDVEEATALIESIRSGEGLPDDEDEEDEQDDAHAMAQNDVAVVVDRRVRLGATVLLALVIGFGTGHMSTGAWGRGFVLAAVEAFGLLLVGNGHKAGVALLGAAVAVDLVGSVIRVRARGAPAKLPAATLIKRR